jgi:glycosidase
MTGNKPDERLRTPMQWTRAAHGGFTRGTPWEALQADSLEVTVQTEDRDPASLLSWHRRLIRLRDATPALAAGTLAALDASDGTVVSYVRRDGDRAVVALANLGGVPARAVKVAAPAGALPPGAWRVVSLLDGRTPAPLRVAADGSVSGWIPLDILAAGGAYLLELRK